MDRCRTIAGALDTIKTLDELQGFIRAINNPAIPTKPVTEQDQQRMYDMLKKWGAKK